MKDFKVGDIVVFTNQDRHYKEPQYFPPSGTKGKVLAVDKDADGEALFVQWPTASTSIDDRWYCDFDDVVKEADESDCDG